MEEQNKLRSSKIFDKFNQDDFIIISQQKTQTAITKNQGSSLPAKKEKKEEEEKFQSGPTQPGPGLKTISYPQLTPFKSGVDESQYSDVGINEV